MEPIKTGIVGCGRNAWALHTPLLDKHPEFKVTAVYDILPEAGQKLADHFHCRSCASMGEFLASDVQFVVVLTTSHVHGEVSCACLKAGKDVLVTKPWAKDTAEADQMIAVAKETGRHLMPFLPQNWGTDLSTARQIMLDGTIGKIYQIRRRASTFGKRYDWQIYKKYAGGYLNNWGPHLLGQILALVDEPIVQVYGETKQIIMGGDAEDDFYAVLKTKSGILVNMEHSIMMDSFPQWTIQGDKGTVFITNDQIEVHKITYPGPIDVTAYRSAIHDDVEKYTLPGAYNGDRYAIYTHIAQVLRGETEYAVSLDFARNLSRVMDAIHQSADTQSLIKLDS